MTNVKIYQLNANHHDKLFFSYAMIGGNVKLSEYDLVWDGELDIDPDDLEEIYFIFNMKHPADFRGHSLSVSDVISVNGTLYYVDSFGYQELGESIEEKWI